VAFSEVEKFLDTPVKRYSSGMYVRLAFSVAAHLEPDILVIDEVLAVGDSSFQKKCLDKMNESSRKDGRTIICVSHNMAMMKALCNSIIWFELGKIKAIGKTEALVSEYLQVSVQKTKTLTNLRDYQRNDADGTQLRIVSLEWLSPLPVTHTERFAVRITFEAYSDIKAVAVGIGISTVEGMRLLTYDMDDPGEPLDVVHGKTYSVSLDIENLPIPPGIYSVDIGARAGPILGLDYLPGCLKIDIFPGKRTALHQKKDRAGVRLPSVWQVESL
jgi:lipopolysaccharide transport system ATP-binding protein